MLTWSALFIYGRGFKIQSLWYFFQNYKTLSLLITTSTIFKFLFIFIFHFKFVVFKMKPNEKKVWEKEVWKKFQVLNSVSSQVKIIPPSRKSWQSENCLFFFRFQKPSNNFKPLKLSMADFSLNDSETPISRPQFPKSGLGLTDLDTFFLIFVFLNWFQTIFRTESDRFAHA